MTQERLFSVRQENYTSNDYWTPKWIFDALGLEFDLDVACPPEGPMFTPCKNFFTQETDGLLAEWYGTVFMNPPFSELTPWVDKYIEHKEGICLLPYSKSKWFNRLWNELDGIVAIPRGRAAFVQGDIFLPCFLGSLGKVSTEALINSKIGRVR
jgi:phage N-6-adenine-methyltransferase